MDRTWLDAQLQAGRSVESIARETGRHPSTVAYWVNRHGLVSAHAARHAARAGIEREELESLVEQGATVEQIASALGLGGTTVRYWLGRHGLRTARSLPGQQAERPSRILRECRRPG